MGSEVCPICNRSDAECFAVPPFGNPFDVKSFFKCVRCGHFDIENVLFQTGQDQETLKLLPYLSGYIRSHQSDPPPVITMANWKDLALAEKAVTVPQKLERLLRLIGDRTPVPGKPMFLDPDIDAPLFDALNTDEVSYLLSYLRDSKLVELGGTNSVKMTVSGWERVIPQVTSGGIPGTCFVAMSFDLALDSAFDEAIYPAAKACGFEANRIDKKLHNGDINDHILAEVKKSQFVIADFTGHSAGVYFEAGFARGLGRDVIWCCRKTDFLEKSHFDTNHYSHILWADNRDLKRQLSDRILATIPNARAVP